MMTALIWLELNRVNTVLDKKVGMRSNDKGLNEPSNEYSFYHGAGGDLLQGNDTVRQGN